MKRAGSTHGTVKTLMLLVLACMLGTCVAFSGVAIVTTVYHPASFDQWLRYHLEVARVVHIYVVIDDPASDAATIALASSFERVTVFLNDEDWKAKVTSTRVLHLFGLYHIDRYETEILSRQSLNAQYVAAYLRETRIGANWLLHIDCDELVFSGEPQGLQKLLIHYESLPVSSFLVGNIEIVGSEVLDESKHSCFESLTLFKDTGFVGYDYGKSIVRLDLGDAYPLDSYVHDWAKHKNYDIAIVGANHLVILHYISCSFDSWLHKYRKAGPNQGDYRRGITLNAFREHSRDLVNTPGVPEKQLRAFYSHWHGDAFVKRVGPDAVVDIKLPSQLIKYVMEAAKKPAFKNRCCSTNHFCKLGYDEPTESECSTQNSL